MKQECKIQTPQFQGSQDKFVMQEQTGWIDTKTWRFEPNKSLTGKGHWVQFKDEQEFNKAKI